MKTRHISSKSKSRGKKQAPKRKGPSTSTSSLSPSFSSFSSSTTQGQYFFGESKYIPGETNFKDPKSDVAFYSQVNKKLLQPIPPLRIDPPIMHLEDIIGKNLVQEIQKNGRIVFHSVGDTGASLRAGPKDEALVTDKMAEDFNDPNSADVPRFLFHLGDVIYNFGEDEYYYDQFYEPFRNYQAPIFAIPGNHDGVVYQSDVAKSLEAFQEHFCSEEPIHAPQAGGLLRTTMTQPGVYFTLSAPFATIIGLYSNVLEDPGVISSQGGTNPLHDDQKNFLISELKRLHAQNYSGAVIIAVHHPPITAGTIHGGSPLMLKDIDDAVKQAGGFGPHAVLAGHAHNYQRFTRTINGQEIPFIIAGSGGHNASPIRVGKGNTTIRTPMKVGDHIFERYFQDYGYLRLVVTQNLMSIEFHDVSSGLDSKSPSDVCTVDLKARKLTTAHA